LLSHLALMHGATGFGHLLQLPVKRSINRCAPGLLLAGVAEIINREGRGDADEDNEQLEREL
jgi:hypothetical protein